MSRTPVIVLALFAVAMMACQRSQTKETLKRTDVVFDTDANNEVDDQHALAYLLFNDSTFNTLGITTNATRGGGAIENHVAEARRIVTLCGKENSIPVLVGADSGFAQIAPHINSDSFDGHEVVDFIVDAANQSRSEKLVVIAVGKLTNVALALKKDPSIANKIRLVWLGSNYPDPGEYNLENDTVSLQYVLGQPVAFELVTVRYGKPSGTDAVKVTQAMINEKMKGAGPKISQPITGRHGGEFTTFGDYSVNLFEHINYYGDPPARALFDMAAVAIVKNSMWAEHNRVPVPVFRNNSWVEQPLNKREVTVWEEFDKQSILNDFFQTMDMASAK